MNAFVALIMENIHTMMKKAEKATQNSNMTRYTTRYTPFYI